MIRKILIALVFTFGFYQAKAQIVSIHNAEIAKLKDLSKSDADAKKLVNTLINDANSALAEKPNPADTILTEGILRGDPRKTRTWNSLADMQKVYSLALAYKINGDKKFLNKATEFLNAWASKNQPQGNPINDTNLDPIIFAYDLLKTDLSTEVNTKVKLWLAKVASQEIKSFKRYKKEPINNWHSHRIKEVTEIAYALNDDSLKSWASTKFKKQIAVNLRADGSSFDFGERDALHYHIYDVDPLMVAAMILNRDEKLKENYYNFTSENGNSLKKSVDWLVPFFTGEKTHAEFVNSKVDFDKKRADNGEKGFIIGRSFDKEEAKTSIALADFFDKKMLNIYQQSTNSTSKYPNFQFLLNAVKRGEH